MSTKTLFSIYVPATQVTLEMWVPDELTVHDATQLICTVVNDREGRWYQPDQNTALYDRLSGDELNINVLVKDLGLVNGSQLVLM
jgi:hypothetical protein